MKCFLRSKITPLSQESGSIKRIQYQNNKARQSHISAEMLDKESPDSKMFWRLNMELHTKQTQNKQRSSHHFACRKYCLCKVFQVVVLVRSARLLALNSPRNSLFSSCLLNTISASGPVVRRDDKFILRCYYSQISLLSKGKLDKGTKCCCSNEAKQEKLSLG